MKRFRHFRHTKMNPCGACPSSNTDAGTVRPDAGWIDNAEIDKLLKGDGDRQIADKPRPGDVVIYRDGEKIVHSATVFTVDESGKVVEVKSLGGLDQEPKVLPPGPGLGTAWEYYASLLTVYRLD